MIWKTLPLLVILSVLTLFFRLSFNFFELFLHKPSKKNKRPVLEAMHITPQISENAVRFSFGPHTTPAAIGELLCAVEEVNKQFNK